MDLELAQLPPPERYKILIGLVIPRPIAWVSTWSENGVANCAPFSFFNVISEAPPLCILSFNRRSDGTLKHTLKNIRRTGEFVVNLADEGTANAMHASSAELPEAESEFARAGLTAFLAGVARTVAPSNVTINFVLPGTFDTDRFRSNVEATAKKKNISHDSVFAERIATIPAKRIGQPDELGTMCAFLCSVHAGYITGQNILIDGGTFSGAF